MAENSGISDADIDALLAEMNKTEDAPGNASGNASAQASGQTPGTAPSTAAPSVAPVGSPLNLQGEASQDEIDALLSAASFDDANAKAAPPPPSGASGFVFPDLQRSSGSGVAQNSIDLLRDVELNVKIELGRSKMLVEDVLKLGEGAVVELDKLAGDPVDVFVNERLVARGEVLVLNDQFCVRVNEIISLKREDLS